MTQRRKELLALAFFMTLLILVLVRNHFERTQRIWESPDVGIVRQQPTTVDRKEGRRMMNLLKLGSSKQEAVLLLEKEGFDVDHRGTTYIFAQRWPRGCDDGCAPRVLVLRLSFKNEKLTSRKFKFGVLLL